MTAPPRVDYEEFDDAREGTRMVVIFVAAVLGVTGAVALVAFINTWLVLGLAVGLHLLMTTIVCLTIAKVMRGTVGRAPLRHL
ncbi:MAG: hypothetical protein ACRDMJ_10230 [Solirubrobacteraceae bacterium]